MLGSLYASTRITPLLPSRCSHGSGDFCLGQKAVHRRQSNQRQIRSWQLLLCLIACLVIAWQLLDLVRWSGTPPVLQNAVALQEQRTANHQQQVDNAGEDIDLSNRLLYPIWWHAPFYTGTGYSTEAISYVSSLLQTHQIDKADIWISHSGDQILEQVADSLGSETLSMLQSQEYANLVRGVLPRDATDRPAIAVCHSFPDCWMLSADKNSMNAPGCPCPPPEVDNRVVYRVGRTMFETNSLPAHLVDHCNAMDEVWVPTEFNRQTFTAAGVSADKLRVVPQGIDAEYFDPDRHQPLLLRELPGAQLVTGAADSSSDGSSHIHSSSSEAGSSISSVGSDAEAQMADSTSSKGVGRRPYVFLSVFKWEARKGWDVLLSAFLQEFSADESVELHIVTKPFGDSKQSIADQILIYLKSHFFTNNKGDSQLRSLPRVYIHTQHIDDGTYPRLYVSCDCLVLPTRGEGWGRPQMEAMTMARPVITTNWSGPTAYISDQVAYPLSIEGLTAADDDMNSTSTDRRQVNEYFVGQMWAQPSVTHLRQLMRHVYDHPAEAAAKGAAARTHILQKFTPAVIAKVLRAEIMRIQDKLGPNRKITDNAAARDQKLKSSQALCMAYPDLCKQGDPGMLEASRRAQSAFSQYRSKQGTQVAIKSGSMTVQEIIAYRKRQRQHQQQQGNDGEYLGTELAVRPSGAAVALLPATEMMFHRRST